MSQHHGPSPEQMKAATRESWNKAAQGWNEQTPKIHGWLVEATETMLDLANAETGAHVLDVAAGAGDQTIDIANRVGPSGYVLATDISPDILRFASENARRAGLTQIETRVADAENLGLADASFDAVVCRLGLMFCPDPLSALREMHRVLKPGGRACTIVFSEPQRNPCMGILFSTALKHAGLPPRDPYQPGGLLSLGKPGLIDELFSKAGFSEVKTVKLQAPYRLPSSAAYLDFIRTSAAPILQILGSLPGSGQQAAWQEMEDKLNAYQTAAGWEGPNELLITVGTR